MDTNKIKDFYENVSKSGKLFRDYIIEMQNPVQKILNEEKAAMINKSLVVNQFKKRIRTSLSNFRIDIYRVYSKLKKREIFTDELLGVEDEMYDDYDFFGKWSRCYEFQNDG